METIQCSQCLYTSNHPFGITFNSDQLCSGCIVHIEKEILDWNIRLLNLKNRLKKDFIVRRRSKRNYDCVVPIRGTPEYFKVLDIVINILKLRPLIVVYNSQYNSEVGIANLDRMREVFDVDLIHYTTNPSIYKKLVKEALDRLGSLRWPYLAGETQFPVKIAEIKKIPLVIWPYHQATEQTGSHSYTEEVEMTRRSRHEYDLMGIEPEQLISNHNLLNKNDIIDITYPADTILSSTQITGIYLSNYFPWDTRKYSEEMIDSYNAYSSYNYRTFDTYDRIDDSVYMSVHDLLKYAKHGYSRVTDSLCREIRFGRITRNDAQNIEAYYQNQVISNEVCDHFCSWLGASHGSIKWMLEHVYRVDKNRGNISLTEIQKSFIKSFSTNNISVMDGRKYITYGKGVY
jgi:N-acetyl sugar amidotransferase